MYLFHIVDYSVNAGSKLTLFSGSGLNLVAAVATFDKCQFSIEKLAQTWQYDSIVKSFVFVILIHRHHLTICEKFDENFRRYTKCRIFCLEVMAWFDDKRLETLTVVETYSSIFILQCDRLKLLALNRTISIIPWVK